MELHYYNLISCYYFYRACFQNYEEEDGSDENETTESDGIPSLLKRELRSLDSHFKVSVIF